MTIAIIAAAVAIANALWVVGWSWWTWRHTRRIAYDVGYTDALDQRAKTVRLAADIAAQYGLDDPQEAVDKITQALRVVHARR